MVITNSLKGADRDLERFFRHRFQFSTSPFLTTSSSLRFLKIIFEIIWRTAWKVSFLPLSGVVSTVQRFTQNGGMVKIEKEQTRTKTARKLKSWWWWWWWLSQWWHWPGRSIWWYWMRRTRRGADDWSWWQFEPRGGFWAARGPRNRSSEWNSDCNSVGNFWFAASSFVSRSSRFL